ncbi:MAG: hypothetical protein ACKPKO_04335, partial [Candidatus Fonsibacter sp.]
EVPTSVDRDPRGHGRRSAGLGGSGSKFYINNNEDHTTYIGFRLWYLEAGLVDELVSYMKQRLLDYDGEVQTRRQTISQQSRHLRPGPITEDQKRAQQIITKTRKCYGKNH